MRLSRLLVSSCILVAGACGGKPVPDNPLPSSPAAAVEQFLAAVRENDLARMGEIYGSDRGPVNYWMASAEREKRLMILESFLYHERYDLDPRTLPGDGADLRVVRVRIERNNCRPVVPFTTRRYREGWLVQSFDIEAAGNPRRPCPTSPTR